MFTIKEMIEKMNDNYDKLSSGERSIQKAKALNESANIIIRLAVLQLTQTAAAAKSNHPLINNEVVLLPENEH